MINNLETLKTAIRDWMGRSDLSDFKLNTAIQTCESNVAYGVQYQGLEVEPLRCRAMEATVDIVADNREVALPDGFLGFRNLYLKTNPIKNLTFQTLEAIRQKWQFDTLGEPVNFTIEGDSLILAPGPDSNYDIAATYYKKIVPLSAENTSNWLLENKPDTYLYGAMAELEQMLDGPNFEKWFGRFASNVNALNAQDKEDRFGGSTLVMSGSPRHRGFNP